MNNISNIVVIEDSSEDFAMITTGLGQSGMGQQVNHLSHPKDVHAWMKDDASEASFIFLDLNLPGGNGIDLLKLLKAHPMHRLAPIVVLTTSENRNDILESYAAGANAYHVKPLETPIFHALIERIATYWFQDARIYGAYA